MPFDSTSLRRPIVTVLPPTPPERRGPRQIRIEIEIIRNDRRPLRNFPQGSGYVSVTFWLLALLLLAALAHAQPAGGPTSWQSYQDGFLRRHSGTDADGGQWSGTSYKQGFTTYSDFSGPNGESRHCRSWQQGWQTMTECN